MSGAQQKNLLQSLFKRILHAQTSSKLTESIVVDLGGENLACSLVRHRENFGVSFAAKSWRVRKKVTTTTTAATTTTTTTKAATATTKTTATTKMKKTTNTANTKETTTTASDTNTHFVSIFRYCSEMIPAQQVLSDTYFQPLLRKNVGHFSRLKITIFVARIIKIRPDTSDGKFSPLYFDIWHA